MYIAVFNNRGWRVQLDGPDIERLDICGAVNEMVARETAFALNEYRRLGRSS